MAPRVNITGDELLRAYSKGVSLDKYADARDLGFKIAQALIIAASKSSVTIEAISECIGLGIRDSEIIGLIKTERNLDYVARILKSTSASTDEAIAAYDTGVPANGGFGYIALRTGQYNIDHQAMIDACETARKASVSRELFMAYTLVLGVDDAYAVDAARALLEPAYYVAATSQGLSHQQIIDRCDTYSHKEQFQLEITKTAEQQSNDLIGELRRQLYSTR